MSLHRAGRGTAKGRRKKLGHHRDHSVFRCTEILNISCVARAEASSDRPKPAAPRRTSAPSPSRTLGDEHPPRPRDASDEGPKRARLVERVVWWSRGDGMGRPRVQWDSLDDRVVPDHMLQLGAAATLPGHVAFLPDPNSKTDKEPQKSVRRNGGWHACRTHPASSADKELESIKSLYNLGP